jgi:hypothetical protein
MYNLSLPIEKVLIAQGFKASQYRKLVVRYHQFADFGVPFHGLFFCFVGMETIII